MTKITAMTLITMKMIIHDNILIPGIGGAAGKSAATYFR